MSGCARIASTPGHPIVAVNEFGEAGAYNTDPVLYPGGGTDYFTLYRVNMDASGNPASPLLTFVERLHVTSNSIAGDTAHFAGSSCSLA